MSQVLNAFQTLRPRAEPGEVKIKRVKGMLFDSNGRSVVPLESRKMPGFSPISKESIESRMSRQMNNERYYQASLLKGTNKGNYRTHR